ncbi:MAG: class I SAM-dependent methyltransferase [Pseudomonadota bacterium]|nr:class I SAM-dependent methyltransferase [Pseudomonadota bacterium]
MEPCIACGHTTIDQFLDLGKTALANKFITKSDLNNTEPMYPLVVGCCQSCGHVQLINRVNPDTMFEDYLYISSLSTTLVEHLNQLAETVVKKFNLKRGELVVDVGSNDGTLLKAFKKKGQNTIGVDPAKNLISLAEENGIETVNAYFGFDSARRITEQYGKASIITATNVFPHIHDFSEFVKGINLLLSPGGALVIEAHYLNDLITKCAFDTIYHEHVSFWSVSGAKTMFNRHGFEIVDVECLPIHHGQIRVFGKRMEEAEPSQNVYSILSKEKKDKLIDLVTLQEFAENVAKIRESIIDTLARLRKENKVVVGYGAPAKGNTLLTYLGIGRSKLPYIADKSPLKQGKFTPGTHIPVVKPEVIFREQPDYVLILAWNFADEIIRELDSYRRQGGKFILPVPKVKII